jgi:hypothetical protein
MVKYLRKESKVGDQGKGKWGKLPELCIKHDVERERFYDSSHTNKHFQRGMG